MNTNNPSQKDHVTEHFWNCLCCETSYPDPEVRAALATFHERLRDRDITKIHLAHAKVIQTLSLNQVQRQKATPLFAIKTDKTSFTSLATTLAGVVHSCCIDFITCPHHRQELAAYLGVTAAKSILRLQKAPSGFKANTMASTLRRYYNAKYSSVGCSSKNMRQFHVPLNLPKLHDGLKLSDEMKSILEQSSMEWTRLWTGLWLNLSRPFDSRTQEWRSFMEMLLASAYQTEAMLVWINYYMPPEPGKRLRSTFFTDQTCSDFTTSIIAKSGFCHELATYSRSHLIAKCGPVNDALRFVVDVLVNPSTNVYEAKIPSGFYATTLWIRFTDWHIQVDIIRP